MHSVHSVSLSVEALDGRATVVNIHFPGLCPDTGIIGLRRRWEGKIWQSLSTNAIDATQMLYHLCFDYGILVKSIFVIALIV